MPKACTASTWKSVCGFFSFIAFPISAIGSTAPISLLVCIIETMIVSSRTASATSSADTRPISSTGRYVTSKPSLSRYFIVSRTAGCSILVVMRCLPLLAFALAQPMSAKLSDSEPQDVKTRFFGWHFSIPESVSFAFLISFSASTPL